MSWRSFKLPSLFNSTIESIKIKMYQSNWIGFGFSPSESILFSLFKVCPESGLEWKKWSVFSSYKHLATKPENSQKKRIYFKFIGLRTDLRQNWNFLDLSGFFQWLVGHFKLDTFEKTLKICNSNENVRLIDSIGFRFCHLIRNN